MAGLEGLLAGKVLVKRYRIEEVIGLGGFAAVYSAHDERLGRTVAVKVITLNAPDAATREQVRERFQREARAAAALPHHPNVVPVYDYGTDPATGIDFLVMELLRGEDLATRLAREGTPAPDLGLRILRAAAEGVAVGHRAGVVHRDVKPGNVFLAEPQGDEPFRVCVLDFGIARVLADEDTLTRLTHGGAPLSPAYASPEQLRGARELTAAADVFSLGVLGWLLLTGEKPFAQGRGGEETPCPAGDLTAGEGITQAVCDVVRRALAHDPAARYPDADAFAEALEAALAGEAAPAAAAVPAAAAAPVVVAAMDDDDRTVIDRRPDPRPAPVAAAGPTIPVPPPSTAPRVVPAGGTRRGGFPAWAMVLLLFLAGGAGAWWAFGRGGDGGDAGDDGTPASAVASQPGGPLTGEPPSGADAPDEGAPEPSSSGSEPASSPSAGAEGGTPSSPSSPSPGPAFPPSAGTPPPAAPQPPAPGARPQPVPPAPPAATPGRPTPAEPKPVKPAEPQPPPAPAPTSPQYPDTIRIPATPAEPTPPPPPAPPSTPPTTPPPAAPAGVPPGGSV